MSEREDPKHWYPPGDPPQPSTTTAEQDRHTGAMRRMNLIWELTQAIIAVSVVLTTLWLCGKIVLLLVNPLLNDEMVSNARIAFNLISNLCTLVIGFYFGRTNHARRGGVNQD